MRTLYEIIDSAKDGEMPSHEECYWAMLALSNVLNMDHMHLRDELSKPTTNEAFRKFKIDNSFYFYKGAMEKDPQVWLCPNEDPRTEEYQRRRKIGIALIDKIASEMEKKDG